MSPTPPRWVRLGASPPLARLALLGVTALGHCLFLTSITGVGASPRTSLLLSAANLTALALAAFRPRPRPLTGRRMFAVVLALNGLVGVAGYAFAAMGQGLSRGHPGAVSGLVMALTYALVGSALGSVVAVPLGLALDRWRRTPSPRTTLDAWAALAAFAAVFCAVSPVRLSALVRTCMENPPLDLCRQIPEARRVASADVAMACFAVALSAALWWTERRARRWLAAARAGRIPGYRLTSRDAVDATHAPDWGLTRAPADHALVAAGVDGGYRGGAAPLAVAVLPLSEDASWREGAMFVVLAVSAMAFAVRALL